MVDRKRTEEQFRVLFDAAPNGVLAVDATGAITLLNAQVEKMFGYSREELIGQPAEILVPERLRRKHIALRNKFAAAPQMRPMGTGRDLIGARKDGSEFAVEVGLNPTATSMGDVVIVTVVDITERKRAAEEENLHQRAQENLQICQLFGLPAAVLQQDGQILHMNPLFKEIDPHFVIKGDPIEVTGPIANEFLKQKLADLDHGDNGKSVGPVPLFSATGHPSLVFHLLPMMGISAGTLSILIVTNLDRTDVAPPDLVQSLFALAPAEARLATLIGSGLSPRQAAKKLGISEGNVRTALKHIFAKVGVSRQSELAVLLTKLNFR